MTGSAPPAAGTVSAPAPKTDVRPYIVKTYDRWIILAIVLVGGWFLFRPLFSFAVYYRGLSFEHMLMLPQAEHYYRKAISVDPHVPEGWQGLGELFAMRARSGHQTYLDAVDTFNSGLRYSPRFGPLAFDLCRIYYEVGKDFPKARSACEYATQVWPDNKFTWDYAAWSNLHVGRRDQAIAFWREALKRGHKRAQIFIDRYSRGG